MKYDVIISDDALADLYDVYRWVLTEAGVGIADAYYERLEARLFSLDHHPNRGTRGIRSVPFERSITVFYRVEAKSVVILRVLSGARELDLLIG